MCDEDSHWRTYSVVQAHEAGRLELTAVIREPDGDRDYASARGVFVEVEAR